MKHTFKRFLTAISLSLCVLSTTVMPAFAAEKPNVSPAKTDVVSSLEVQPRSSTITTYEGAFFGWKEVYFTVRDTTNPVKVMYAARYVDGTNMNSSFIIRNSSGNTVFSSPSLSGPRQIVHVGRLSAGNYTMIFKPSDVTKQYAISGQVYNFY